MELINAVSTSQTHANNFEEGSRVFVATEGNKKVVVKTASWNTTKKTFQIFLDGIYMTATPHYHKAIGMAVLFLYGLKQTVDSESEQKK